MAQEFDDVVRRPLLSYVPNWIHPNHLSYARALLLIPLIPLGDVPIAALTILLLSSLCDLLDGPLARVRGLVSTQGAVLDELMDKIFLNGTLFLVCANKVPEDIRWVVLSLDCCLAMCRPFKRRVGARSDANSWGAGKVWALTAGIGCALSGDNSLIYHMQLFFYMAIALACFSLVSHLNDIAKKLY